MAVLPAGLLSGGSGRLSGSLTLLSGDVVRGSFRGCFCWSPGGVLSGLAVFGLLLPPMDSLIGGGRPSDVVR